MSAAPILNPRIPSTFPVALANRQAGFQLRRGPHGRPRHDDQDARQDLLTAAVAEWPRYSPARGMPSTYLRNVMHRKLISVHRVHSAAKRGFGFRQQSWNEITTDKFADTPAERIARRLDVRILVNSLPEPLKQLCLVLMKFSIAEAARQLGITRDTANYRVRLIRERFIAAGLAP